MSGRRFAASRETLTLRLDGDQWACLYVALSFAQKRATHEATCAKLSADRDAEALYVDQARTLRSIIDALEGVPWECP